MRMLLSAWLASVVALAAPSWAHAPVVMGAAAPLMPAEYEYHGHPYHEYHGNPYRHWHYWHCHRFWNHWRHRWECR
jgi:hypothetical protein